MVVRQQPGLGRVLTRPATSAPARPGAARPWDDSVRIVTPDAHLDQAITIARHAVGQRQVLQPGIGTDGVGRLAEKLAATAPEDDRLAKLLGVVRSRVAEDGIVASREDGRPSPMATAVLGRCEVAQHDPRAWERLAALSAALGEGHPGGGDPACAAALLALASTLLAQVRCGDVEILPVLPDAWFGEDVEVHGLPVAGGGRISWSIRWPTDWPQLRWASSVPGHRVTAPGLAPGWSDRRPRGTADLSPDGA